MRVGAWMSAFLRSSAKKAYQQQSEPSTPTTASLARQGKLPEHSSDDPGSIYISGTVSVTCVYTSGRLRAARTWRLPCGGAKFRVIGCLSLTALSHCMAKRGNRRQLRILLTTKENTATKTANNRIKDSSEYC